LPSHLQGVPWRRMHHVTMPFYLATSLDLETTSPCQLTLPSHHQVVPQLQSGDLTMPTHLAK